MYKLLNELVGKKCEISTLDEYYEGVIRRVEGNILVIFDDSEEKEVYVNLLNMNSVKKSDEETEKPKKLRLFGKKDDSEDM